MWNHFLTLNEPEFQFLSSIGVPLYILSIDFYITSVYLIQWLVRKLLYNSSIKYNWYKWIRHNGYDFFNI